MTNLILDALTSDVSRGRMLRLSNETAREYMEWMLKVLSIPYAGYATVLFTGLYF